MWLLLATFSWAGSIDSLLKRGELSLLETYPDGRLKQVTAMAQVKAPSERVWALLVDFARYGEWMPQVKAVSVKSQSETEAVVEWTVAVVGPDIRFTQKLVLDQANLAISGTHAAGALPGSHWEWHLEPAGENTLVERTVRVNVVDSNWFVKQVEDEHHTLDFGINSAIGVVELRGLARKLAAER